MTKAEMRNRAHNYMMKPFETACIVCKKTTKHMPILSTFRDTPEGTVLDKLGYCTQCGQYNEKQLKPVQKKNVKPRTPKVEAVLA